MEYTCNDDIAKNQHTVKLLCLFKQQSLQSTELKTTHIGFHFFINTRLHKLKMCLAMTKKNAQVCCLSVALLLH